MVNMTDSLFVERAGAKPGERIQIRGVHCVEKDGIKKDSAGFSGGGEMVVRIPKGVKQEIDCGDRICRVGSHSYYTVVEIRDNCMAGSALSHRKLIAKR